MMIILYYDEVKFPVLHACNWDSTMEQVLQDLNLKAYTKTFIDEKITHGIVCKLSSHEMEALGVRKIQIF